MPTTVPSVNAASNTRGPSSIAQFSAMESTVPRQMLLGTSFAPNDSAAGMRTINGGTAATTLGITTMTGTMILAATAITIIPAVPALIGSELFLENPSSRNQTLELGLCHIHAFFSWDLATTDGNGC